MDRRQHLANVAFGGNWSEEIVPAEERAAALATLRQAIAQAWEEDPRTGPVRAALALLTRGHPKAALLAERFERAAALPAPGLRLEELQRLLAIVERMAGQEGARPDNGSL